MLARLVVIISLSLLQLPAGLRAADTLSDHDCQSVSMVDFVKDTLPRICFDSDTAGFLNYSMDNVEFYNAHCRVYQDIKQCLETKLKHCNEIRPGFHRHVLNLIESYQLPLEYFDYNAKIYDDNHYLQNLIPFCDGPQLSSRSKVLVRERCVAHRSLLSS